MMLALYKTILTGLTPVLNVFLQRRVKRGKEDPARLHERRGIASLARPAGRLVWCHAASVGESVSLLPVVEWLSHLSPDIQILVTTGTVTSARIMAQRLPARAFHQYVPVDHPAWTARFLDHWRPDCVIWSESELWPNMLAQVKARKIPAALLNARMSPESYRKWSWMGDAARDVLSTFDLCLAQDAAEAGRLKSLGAQDVRVSVNLKYAARELPADPQKLADFQNALGGRPVILWASTHSGDEAAAIRVHAALVKETPDLLTVIVPRHPARGKDIAALIRSDAAGFGFVQRSLGALPQLSDAFYLADTLGELGLFFRAVRLVVMGGSLERIGGHNPIEPAQLGACVFFGPSRHNFETITHDFRGAGAFVDFANENDLTKKLGGFLRDPAAVSAVGAQAQDFCHTRKAQAEKSFDTLLPFLNVLMRGAA